MRALVYAVRYAITIFVQCAAMSINYCTRTRGRAIIHCIGNAVMVLIGYEGATAFINRRLGRGLWALIVIICHAIHIAVQSGRTHARHRDSKRQHSSDPMLRTNLHL